MALRQRKINGKISPHRCLVAKERSLKLLQRCEKWRALKRYSKKLNKYFVADKNPYEINGLTVLEKCRPISQPTEIGPKSDLNGESGQSAMQSSPQCSSASHNGVLDESYSIFDILSESSQTGADCSRPGTSRNFDPAEKCPIVKVTPAYEQKDDSRTDADFSDTNMANCSFESIKDQKMLSSTSTVESSLTTSIRPCSAQKEENEKQQYTETNGTDNFCLRCGSENNNVQIPAYFDEKDPNKQEHVLLLCWHCARPYGQWRQEPWKFVGYFCSKARSLASPCRNCQICHFWSCTDFVKTHLALNYPDYNDYLECVENESIFHFDSSEEFESCTGSQGCKQSPSQDDLDSSVGNIFDTLSTSLNSSFEDPKFISCEPCSSEGQLCCCPSDEQTENKGASFCGLNTDRHFVDTFSCAPGEAMENFAAQSASTSTADEEQFWKMDEMSNSRCDRFVRNSDAFKLSTRGVRYVSRKRSLVESNFDDEEKPENLLTEIRLSALPVEEKLKIQRKFLTKVSGDDAPPEHASHECTSSRKNSSLTWSIVSKNRRRPLASSETCSGSIKLTFRKSGDRYNICKKSPTHESLNGKTTKRTSKRDKADTCLKSKCNSCRSSNAKNVQQQSHANKRIRQHQKRHNTC